MSTQMSATGRKLSPPKTKDTKKFSAVGQLCVGARLAMAPSLPEHLENLALFGANDELHWSWKSANQLLNEDLDPSKPPKPGCNPKFLRFLLKRFVENLFFRVFSMLLIIVDICLVITDATNCPIASASNILRKLDLAFSSYFILEVTLRIIGLTPQVFFSKKSWYNILDFGIVLITFAISIASYVLIEAALQNVDKDIRDSNDCTRFDEEEKTKGAVDFFKLLKIARFVRLVRFIRLIRIFIEHRNVVRGVRQLIGQNKRRYQVDGFDLDLTYVTNQIIAMSFPSKGKVAMYRNKIESVARFFDEKHATEDKINFMIYDLCSEMDYDIRKFHGHVQRYRIEDHNVPRLSEMKQLVKHVKKWLEDDDDRVVALHCKGGKGRTGTMICAILIDQGLFEDAEKCLQYFGERRTDLNVGKTFQGVETYSQIRYVHYFQKLQNNSLDSIPLRPLQIKKICITGLKKIGEGDGSDFSMKILNHDGEIYSCSFNDNVSCSTSYKYLTGLEVELDKPPTVDGDTKFIFYCSTPSVPKGYDNCAFFFWLNTFFVEKDSQALAENVRHLTDDPKSRRVVENYRTDGEERLKVLLKREVLDNPHKPKSWNVWGEDFSIEVTFVKPGSEPIRSLSLD